MGARYHGPRVLAALSILAAESAARAQGVTEIQWSAPPGCPGEAEVRAAVGRLLSRPIDQRGSAVWVVGQVTQDPDGGRWRLRLSIARRGGLPKERRLEGDTCAQLTDAATVVLALAIDDGGLPGTEGAPRSPEPPPDEPAPLVPPVPRPSPPPPPEDPPELESAPPPPSPAIWDLGLMGGVDVSSLPSPTALLGLTAGVDLGPNRIEMRALGLLPRSAALAGDPIVGGSFSLLAADLRYCRWLIERNPPKIPIVDVAPCAGLEGGVILASATGAALSAPGVSRWLAPQLGLLVAVRPTPRFSLSVALDGLAAVFRDDFTVQDAGVVYHPSAATFRAALGAQLRFP